jgi:hypothetical protein
MDMYIKKTFKRAYDLLIKYWKNMIVYIVPSLLSLAVYSILAVIMYFGVYLGTFLSIIFPLFLLLSIPIGVIFLVIFIAATSFIETMHNRIVYLTSNETDIPLKKSSLFSLLDYAGENFLQFFKLNIINYGIAFAIALIFGIVGYVLIFNLQFPTNLIFLIPLLILMVIVSIVFGSITHTAVILFFMENEKKGVLALLRMGWELFSQNILEYILLYLAYLPLGFIYLSLILAFLSTFLCFFSYFVPILHFFFIFYTRLVMFVFVNFLRSKKSIGKKE